MEHNKKLNHFDAKIFAGNRTSGEAEHSFSGKGQQWQDYRIIKLPGFDGSQTLNLDDFWFEVFKQQQCAVTLKLVGLESIIKYAHVQQIKEPFNIVANLSFADVNR